MHEPIVFDIYDLDLFVVKAIEWGEEFNTFMLLNSNSGSFKTKSSFLPVNFDVIIAAGCKANSQIYTIDELKLEANQQKWLFGSINYEYKNKLEHFNAIKTDNVGFNEFMFFEPEIVIAIKNNKAYYWGQSFASDINDLLNFEYKPLISNTLPNENLRSRVSKTEYIEAVNRIKGHIVRGDIYEVNYCFDFYSNHFNINPIEIYQKLNKQSPAPFSTFYKHESKYLICSSPERFLHKVKQKLYSMPIKGTIKRGKTIDEDIRNIEFLRNHSKERSENIMITDLVRNDLSKSAIPGSVTVEELCEVYTFSGLHQMISTVSAVLASTVHWADVIKNAFPMGSMTGAPKYKAMQIIDEFEPAARGLYSGTVGYIAPNGDFDFNVVIRSISYNQKSGYLTFHVGSAITSGSEPEGEYNECLLKAEGMFKALGINI